MGERSGEHYPDTDRPGPVPAVSETNTPNRPGSGPLDGRFLPAMLQTGSKLTSDSDVRNDLFDRLMSGVQQALASLFSRRGDQLRRTVLYLIRRASESKETRKRRPSFPDREKVDGRSCFRLALARASERSVVKNVDVDGRAA